MPAQGEDTDVLRPGSRHFGRDRRLRRSRDFQRVSRRGRRASSRHFVLLVAPSENETAFADGRLGLTVSRRVGGAVVRNRVKRRAREWFRRSALPGGTALDWVVIARRGAGQLAAEATREELEALGRKAMTRGAR